MDEGKYRSIFSFSVINQIIQEGDQYNLDVCINVPMENISSTLVAKIYNTTFI